MRYDAKRCWPRCRVSDGNLAAQNDLQCYCKTVCAILLGAVLSACVDRVSIVQNQFVLLHIDASGSRQQDELVHLIRGSGASQRSAQSFHSTALVVTGGSNS